MKMNEIELSNDINIITAQIKSFEEAGNYLIWEIGRRLVHVKNNKLNHGDFGDWLNELNMNHDLANRYMKIVKELDGKYDSNRNLGLQNLYAIATLPEEERTKEHVITKGETKTPDEMTVRELQELKKQLKKKDALLSKKDKQLKEHEERIEELELIGPEVIEKKIEVEKVPEDYQAAKTENESLKKQLSSIQSDLRLLKIEHDLLEKNTAEAKRLEANIQTLRKQERSIDKKVKALFDFNDRIININRFFDTEMASLRFKPLINELQDTYATNQLISVVDMVQAWVEEMQAILPDKNRKIIEGEIIDD